ETAQLNELLKGIQQASLSPYDRLLFDLATVLQQFSAAPAASSTAETKGAAAPSFEKKHRQALSRFLRSHQNDKSMLRVFYRAARLIASRTGSRWPILWAYRQQYLPVFAGIAIAIIVILLRSAL